MVNLTSFSWIFLGKVGRGTEEGGLFPGTQVWPNLFRLALFLGEKGLFLGPIFQPKKVFYCAKLTSGRREDLG